MKAEFLQNFKVGDASLPKEAVDAILAENQRDVEAAKKPYSDYEDIKERLRTELMGEGVPEAYDTFKELADYIETHQTAADALTAAVGNKVDKVEGKVLSSNDYTDEEKAKLAGLAVATDAEVQEMLTEVFGEKTA